MRQLIDLDLDLLDRRVVDADGRHVGKVDDLLLELPADDSAPRVTALLLGPGALGGRFGSRLGGWIAAAGRRLAADSTGMIEIPIERVRRIGNVVELDRAWEKIPGRRGLETWLRDDLIGRLPGAHRDP